jgi:phosphoglycerol transferase MdoB-like AlkP superfamily enzyme
MASLGGEKDVAVNLDKLGQEGVLFTHFYANSFRTDRGLVSILSGFPAQPTTSLMKYPRKTAHLPSIASELRKAGYGTKYYYGGDADFTNMRSYLVSQGFNDIVSDVDFPVSDRLSKWGVPDHLVFARLLEDLHGKSSNKPMLRVVQTSSSHEPFDVPYQRLSDERLNAFAYTDDCVGRFVDSLRHTANWSKSLVIIVPDHLGCYPRDISNLVPERYEIPLIMVGGAIAEPRRVEVIGSQHDLAATLLAQLGVDHSQFKFSKNILDETSPHFAFFTVPDAFGFVTTENRIIFDNKAQRVVWDDGGKNVNLEKGKAYLQKLYDQINEL